MGAFWSSMADGWAVDILSSRNIRIDPLNQRFLLEKDSSAENTALLFNAEARRMRRESGEWIFCPPAQCSCPRTQIADKRIPAFRRITVALIQKTDLQAGGQKKFVYSHIDDRGSIAVAVQDSGISVYIRIEKIGRLVVAGVDGGRTLLKMIVALSGIGEPGISRDIAVRPCHIGATPAIGHSACAKDIVESADRLFMYEGTTVKTGLPGFCDYYVISQFRPETESIGKDAGTV
jgi:hypothetical protein